MCLGSTACECPSRIQQDDEAIMYFGNPSATNFDPVQSEQPQNKCTKKAVTVSDFVSGIIMRQKTREHQRQRTTAARSQK
jgi:hypothetical protein